VLLPRRLLALGAAKVADFAPCASFRCGGLTDVALVGRLLQHVLHLDQLSLVVLHVLDKRANDIVNAEDILVDELLGEVLSEECGEGFEGDDVLVMRGGEPLRFPDTHFIEFGPLSKLKRRYNIPSPSPGRITPRNLAIAPALFLRHRLVVIVT